MPDLRAFPRNVPLPPDRPAPFAFMTGAVFVWFCTGFFTKKSPAAHHWVVEKLSHVTIVSLIFVFKFGIW
jgi:low affinity Fe/Cu permease